MLNLYEALETRVITIKGNIFLSYSDKIIRYIYCNDFKFTLSSFPVQTVLCFTLSDFIVVIDDLQVFLSEGKQQLKKGGLNEGKALKKLYLMMQSS